MDVHKQTKLKIKITRTLSLLGRRRNGYMPTAKRKRSTRLNAALCYGGDGTGGGVSREDTCTLKKGESSPRLSSAEQQWLGTQGTTWHSSYFLLTPHRGFPHTVTAGIFLQLFHLAPGFEYFVFLIDG